MHFYHLNGINLHPERYRQKNNFAEKSKKNEYQKITNIPIFKDIDEILYTLTLDDGSSIKSTKDHRFYTYRDEEYQYIAIKELKIGDVVKYANGTYHKITKISNTPIKETVYNLTIAKNANFYVGTNGILVHNIYEDGYCDYTVDGYCGHK